jgi:two-component system phosphate regulon sensor histidine kinase PhoR
LSIFWKQFFSSVLITLIILSLFVFFAVRELRSYDESVTGEMLLASANAVGETLRPALEGGRPSDVDSLLKKLGAKSDMRITVIDRNGNALGDSHKIPRAAGTYSDSPEVKEALSGEVGKGRRYSSELESEMYYLAVPVKDGSGNIIAAVRTALPLGSLQGDPAAPEKHVVYIAALLAVLSALLFFIVTKKITSPLLGIISISEELARGNLDVSIPAASEGGEASRIKGALDKMARNLSGLFKEVSREKNQLKAVLGAMSEGVMVLSSDGKVVITNNALRNMFNLKEEPGRKPFWEIIRNRELTRLVEGVLERRTPDSKEIFYLYPDERHYFVNVIPLDSPDREIIVVMFDITDFKRLEKIKADFIANVSHELRTPLTAIKGYTETLEEEAYESPEDRVHFLGIIKRHTDRLINIVSDLLVLSEVESRDTAFGDAAIAEVEEINLNEVIKSSLEALRSAAAEKDLDVSFATDNGAHRIKASRFLLEQMFINLIDNAVKYTPDSGKIAIRISSSAGGAVLTEIEDTGIGIPKEHLPRIFERFYRVDKTRSRNLGGTGLGLSIVKHVVIMHGGKIDVHSEEGKGSRFSISLPYSYHPPLSDHAPYSKV